MRTIAIANQKGGCGKTTTAINCSACLAQLGKNVLLIDLDPQGHATLGLNVRYQDLSKSMYEVLTPVGNKKTRLDEIIIPITQKFDLAPANILLSAVEQELSGKPEREAKLYQAISLMVTEKTYDFIIIDCPPSLGLLTFNGLRCADEIIAPVETGFFSLQGISRLLEIVNLLNNHIDNKVKIKALITMFDRRTKFSHEVRDEIYKYFMGNVLHTTINNNVRLKEASSYGMPVTAYDKHCQGSKDYRDLAKELINGQIIKEETEILETLLKPGFSPQRINSGTLFAYYAPSASCVEITGDFNNWVVNQKSNLDAMQNGVWRKIYDLKPGRYLYKFVVDGKWTLDPNNPNIVSDTMGNKNSFVEVK